MVAGEKPLISVVVPVYNVAQYLPRCVDSLLNQTFDRCEIILVDDCSTDNSAEILRQYAGAYPGKIRFIQRLENGGLSAARNTGLEYSSGQWVSFVDSDDWVDASYLSELYRAAEETGADVVLGGVLYAYADGRLKDASTFGRVSDAADKREILALCRAYAWSRLFRRSMFQELGILFPEDIKRSEDICTIIPLLTYAKKIALLRKPLYYYYQRSGSISNTNVIRDFSFIDRVIERMYRLSAEGYGEELEYRAIHELLYSVILIMHYSSRPVSEIGARVALFEKSYPNWRENPYLPRMPLGKRLFIRLAAGRKFTLLRLLTALRNLLKR